MLSSWEGTDVFMAEVVERVDLPTLICEMPDTDRWEDVGIVQCLQYIKKSSKLKIPEEFRGSVGSYLENL